MASRALTKWEKKYNGLKASSARARKKAAELVNTVVRTGEVGGTAFAFGVVKGRTGDTPNIAGVPLDLGLGLGMHAFALLGGTGAENHFRAIGDGALASYLHTVGVDVGGKMLGAGGPAVQGYLDEGEEEMAGGYGLSEAELEMAGL